MNHPFHGAYWVEHAHIAAGEFPGADGRLAKLIAHKVGGFIDLTTEFFERAGMQDTKVAHGHKDGPAEVARDGYEALMAGKDHVVAGSWRNKAQAAAAKVLPRTATAAIHGAQTKPRPDDG